MAKILIVDDEKNILKSINRILRDKNYDLMLVNNSEKALALLDQQEFDVLIADQKMEYVQGIDLLIYAKKRNPNIITILMTGYSELNVIIDAVNKANIFKYLAKPWEKGELLAVVEEAVQIKRERDLRMMSKHFLTENNLLEEAKKTVAEEGTIQIISPFIGQGIRILLKVIETKDIDLLKHSQKVAAIAKKYAEFLGYDSKTIDVVYYSGLLHDIGKIAIRDEIIYKSGKLNQMEYNSMKYHASVGAELIREVDGLERIAKVVEQHHENIDGSGYPNNLSGKEIFEEALIVSISDMYSALSEKRVYKDEFSFDKIINILNNVKEKKYPSAFVDKFIKFIQTTKEITTA